MDIVTASIGINKLSSTGLKFSDKVKMNENNIPKTPNNTTAGINKEKKNPMLPIKDFLPNLFEKLSPVIVATGSEIKRANNPIKIKLKLCMKLIINIAPTAIKSAPEPNITPSLSRRE